jgi:hypothetical protein
MPLMCTTLIWKQGTWYRPTWHPSSWFMQFCICTHAWTCTHKKKRLIMYQSNHNIFKLFSLMNRHEYVYVNENATKRLPMPPLVCMYCSILDYTSCVAIFGYLMKFLWDCILCGSQRGSMWPRGCTSCWWMCTTKSLVMPFMSTKSDACMSTLWLLGNVFTAKSCKSKKQISDPSKLGPTS